MSNNKSKDKGSRWEREIARLFNENFEGADFRRIPGSGALGTQLGIASLGADIEGKLPFLQKTIRGEAKTGYGGEKQLTVKREWLEQIREEAEKTNSIPMLFAKFLGARGNSRIFVMLDWEAFLDILDESWYNYSEHVRLLNKVEARKNDVGNDEDVS